MKPIIFFLSILTFSNCLQISNLNKQIEESQNEAWINSPFIEKEQRNNVKWSKQQLKFRTQYQEDLEQLSKENPNDTIFLVENYDGLCIGCPANVIQIYIGRKLITYKTEDYKSYKKEISYLEKCLFDSSGYWHKDIYELYLAMRKRNIWNQKPEIYGDKCLGTGGSFYTIMFPSGKVESMYIECWKPKIFKEYSTSIPCW